MGQHKHNPNCNLAKAGLLPPKKKKIGKRAIERLLMEFVRQKTGVNRLMKMEGN